MLGTDNRKMLGSTMGLNLCLTISIYGHGQQRRTPTLDLANRQTTLSLKAPAGPTLCSPKAQRGDLVGS